MPSKRRNPFGDLEPRRQPDRPLAVSELNELARRRLEEGFDDVWVSGEISNFTHASSGHLYFSLKDDRAQIAAVMWRSAASWMSFRPRDGLAVQARGRLTIYPVRGQYQLVVEKLEPAGEGDLQQRFLELKRRYEERGWFEPDEKTPLPFLPGRIGIVTSPSGAAVHDMLQTIDRRFPRAHVVIVPVRVQGAAAAGEIAAAIDRVDAERLCDVLIVGRGGGSLEDLWAFNEPAVVEAIHRARTPIISAVGHEVDVTLSDLVADFRALTPTAAGEAVVPELAVIEDDLGQAGQLMRRRLRARLDEARARLGAAGESWALREPRHLVQRVAQRLDELRAQLPVRLAGRLERARVELSAMGVSIGSHAAARRVAAAEERLSVLRRGLDEVIVRRLELAAALVGERGRLLEGLSPLRVLERGFSLTVDARGRIVRDASDVAAGETIRTRLARGEVESRVERAVPRGGSGESAAGL